MTNPMNRYLIANHEATKICLQKDFFKQIKYSLTASHPWPYKIEQTNILIDTQKKSCVVLENEALFDLLLKDNINPSYVDIKTIISL